MHYNMLILLTYLVVLMPSLLTAADSHQGLQTTNTSESISASLAEAIDESLGTPIQNVQDTTLKNTFTRDVVNMIDEFYLVYPLTDEEKEHHKQNIFSNTLCFDLWKKYHDHDSIQGKITFLSMVVLLRKIGTEFNDANTEPLLKCFKITNIILGIDLHHDAIDKKQ